MATGAYRPGYLGDLILTSGARSDNLEHPVPFRCARFTKETPHKIEINPQSITGLSRVSEIL
jgi:hypothetical protein